VKGRRGRSSSQQDRTAGQIIFTIIMLKQCFKKTKILRKIHNFAGIRLTFTRTIVNGNPEPKSQDARPRV
jgi:hypothetical protein